MLFVLNSQFILIFPMLSIKFLLRLWFIWKGCYALEITMRLALILPDVTDLNSLLVEIISQADKKQVNLYVDDKIVILEPHGSISYLSFEHLPQS